MIGGTAKPSVLTRLGVQKNGSPSDQCGPYPPSEEDPAKRENE